MWRYRQVSALLFVPRVAYLNSVSCAGVGAMTEWTDIVQIVKDAEANRPKDVSVVPPRPASPFYNDVT